MLRQVDKKEQSRLFVAVDMPAAVVQEIARAQDIIKREALFEGKFVDPQQVHLTLKFIGEVSTKQIPSIEKALDKVKDKTMEAQLGSLDVFAAGNRIKIIFLSLVCPELADLAQKIEQALLPWCPAEKRSFVTHATIARVKRIENENKERLLGLLAKLSVKPIQFTIDSFVLKESELSEKGPIYIDKAWYKLEG